MRKMRQGPPIGRTPPPAVARGERSAVLDMHLIPAAFSQNQIGAVVLPLVSDCQKLIWVDAVEIDPQTDAAALLDQTFDAFPYPTPERTAALARRCALHLDQVRAWFMLQRLRHGISWDCADVPKVRKKIGSRRGTAARRKTDSVESEEREPGGKKARTVREGRGTSGGRAADEGAGGDELLQREIEASGAKRKTQKRQRRTAETRKRGAERDAVEGAEAKAPMASAESKRWRSASNGKPTDGVTEVTDAAAADGPLSRPRRKTRSQLVMMKKVFLSCQYPDGEYYDHLARQSGVPRFLLVQWFSDMRYNVKKKIPHWMNQQQHQRALANILYRQWLTGLQPKKSTDVKDGAGQV